MLSDYKYARNSQRSGICSVGVLESGDVSEKEYINYLSIMEKERFVGIKNKKRRREWLTGRLAAKYLFLNQLDMDSKTQAVQWEPALLKLTPESLRPLSPWMYRKIEVLSNKTTQNRYPSLIWCGKDSAVNVSLSHIGGMSCACIAFGGAIGIDLEMTAPRIESFYRGNFTKAERDWVKQMSGDILINPDWLYTFLWTLKESVLKSRSSNEISIWDVAGIEIKILTGLKNILVSYNNKWFGNDFLFLKVQIIEQYRSMYAQVALTATRNQILTVIKI